MAKIVFEEDAEIVIPESTKETEHNALLDSDSSDDEAPEAVSTSKAKEDVISRVQAEKEATTKLAAAEKEKRRLRDQFLKEQKQGSKRQQKELEKKAKREKLEKEYNEKMEKRKRRREEEEEEEGNDVDEAKDDVKDAESNFLPQELLNQALEEEKAEQIQNKKHISAEDFERIIAAEEEKEKERAKKRKAEEKGKVVGEYTVKVLNNRPKLQKASKRMINMRDMHLHRSAVPRKEAVVNISSGRDGAACLKALVCICTSSSENLVLQPFFPNYGDSAKYRYMLFCDVLLPKCQQ
ncbi:hypothetical protein BDF20DRAFT_839100 [Mycotypha africana]|uniref:uncharacterized protein n=1 Tax=Mycotypha africana TaxID=64632 RepID=UPI00230183A6|nr:uncharacterized protein BDF20DRAFT_839100 [Mycotypha africana]KAI8969153.1 hypothetical protein BDF20DRAFT_839100 [Mycotypha africana]